jgi:hypothetical protein
MCVGHQNDDRNCLLPFRQLMGRAHDDPDSAGHTPTRTIIRTPVRVLRSDIVTLLRFVPGAVVSFRCAIERICTGISKQAKPGNGSGLYADVGRRCASRNYPLPRKCLFAVGKSINSRSTNWRTDAVHRQHVVSRNPRRLCIRRSIGEVNMAKARKFIPGTVLASVLSVPAVTFAHNAGPLAREQVRAAPVQIQRASYLDSTDAATGFPVTFQAAMARVQAQKEAFELYGGARSSSAMRSPSRQASGKRGESDR